MSKPDIEYRFYGDKRTHCITLAFRRFDTLANTTEIAAAFLRKGDKFCAETGKAIAFLRLHERTEAEHYVAVAHKGMSAVVAAEVALLTPDNPLGVPNTPEYRKWKATERNGYAYSVYKAAKPHLKPRSDGVSKQVLAFMAARDEISRNAEPMSDTALGFALDSMTLPMLWQLYARVAIESKADMDALVPIELQITRRLQEEWGVCLAHVINAKRFYGYL